MSWAVFGEKGVVEFHTPIQEVGLNKGVGYREATKQYYPAYRLGAIFPWKLYITKHSELPTYVHFSTREAAIQYIKEN